MNRTESPRRTLHIAGLGVPLLDVIAPTRMEWARGARMIEAISHNLPSGLTLDQRVRALEIAQQGHGKIADALAALQHFENYCVAHQYKPGDKKNLTNEDAPQIAAWFETMLEAARDINEAAAILGRSDEKVLLRHSGGTLANKFHTTKSALGNGVEAHLFGAQGDEDISGNRARLFDNLTKSGIDFQQIDGVSLGNMAVSYILMHGNDRIVLKAPIENLAELLAPHQDKITDFVDKDGGGQPADYYFIEGSDYGPKKFGAETFLTYANRVMESGKPIIFSPPTDLALLDDPQAHAIMERILDHPATALVCLNEAEVTTLFNGHELDKKATTEVRLNPELLQAIDVVRQHLAMKKEHQAPGMPEPIAFVSVGVEGAFSITARGVRFVPGTPSKQFVNNLGAGDAFASGVFVEYLRQQQNRAPGDHHEFTKEELDAMNQTGQRLGCATVEIKGTQLPAGDIAQIVHGDAPTQGTVTAIVPPPEPEITR